MIADLRRHLYLVWLLSITQLRVKYRASVLGFLWTLITPLGMMIIFLVVFSIFLRWDIEDYPLYLIVGLILWRFFQNGTTAGMHAIVGRADIVRAIYFPRLILTTAAVLTAFIDALLELAVFLACFLLLSVPGVDVGIAYLLQSAGFNVTSDAVPGLVPCLEWIVFPSVLAAEFFIVEGISLALCTLYVYFRDLREIWALFTQALFFLTPVFYPPTLVPLHLLEIYNLNPLARTLTIARGCLGITPLPGFGFHLVLHLMAILILSAGLAVYLKLQKDVVRAI